MTDIPAPQGVDLRKHILHIMKFGVNRVRLVENAEAAFQEKVTNSFPYTLCLTCKSRGFAKGKMVSLREDGINKVLKGVTTVEEVLRVTQL